MAASTPERGRPRWWRRSRDLALDAARAAHADATSAMALLESLEVDLTELTTIHAESEAGTAGPPGHPVADPVAEEWDAHSARTGMVALEFYELDTAYDPSADYEEPDARTYAARFGAVAEQLRGLAPTVEGFRDRHAGLLAAAAALRDEVPALVEQADGTLQQASRALSGAGAAGLTDPQAWAAHAAATSDLAAARNRSAERRWVPAHRHAQAAVRSAREALERAASLDEAADTVRKGFLSVRTRRDALLTQHDRLPDVMSQLRRRYSYGSWQHLDDAPKRIDAAMEAVDAGLASLARVLDVQPLDVPAAADLLAGIRAAAADVSSILRAATDLLERLDEVSADPEQLLAAVRRKTLDARRFLANLPDDKADRFRYTFDTISSRTQRLAAAVHEARPDWGALIAEAESIEAALDAMINAARTS
ncbi:hypothetical protein [Nocardioides sp. TF02-7]|uniref:hypothetical protein n=1 Tax=Nocardioides sp. TF02-7 TaxID=2917724 RepID=UPI001F0574CC|nr:hypothetical protein [Nocardioides sp. TF02-7]UMG92612.1 hypothetical protein MF408_22990 [Nocardioides sp. TF02-7]